MFDRGLSSSFQGQNACFFTRLTLDAQKYGPVISLHLFVPSGDWSNDLLVAIVLYLLAMSALLVLVYGRLFPIAEDYAFDGVGILVLMSLNP